MAGMPSDCQGEHGRERGTTPAHPFHTFFFPKSVYKKAAT